MHTHTQSCEHQEAKPTVKKVSSRVRSLNQNRFLRMIPQTQRPILGLSLHTAWRVLETDFFFSLKRKSLLFDNIVSI